MRNEIHIQSYSYHFHGPWLNLICRDMSNNTFDVSDVPDWFSTLQSLTTLYVSFLLHLWMFVCRCACVSRKRKRVKCSEWTDLSTLYGRMMENTRLQGKVPQALFSFSNLQTVWVSYWYIVAPHSRMNVARILTALISIMGSGAKEENTQEFSPLYIYHEL